MGDLVKNVPLVIKEIAPKFFSTEALGICLFNFIMNIVTASRFSGRFSQSFADWQITIQPLRTMEKANAKLKILQMTESTIEMEFTY